MIYRRRTVSRILMLAALAAAAIGPVRGEAAKGKPNILFLLSDDHSYPYLGAYGSKSVRTPNLDRLAGQGMRFDSMFVGCPQCVPSRATLMTGRSPVSVRMVRFTSPLPPDVVALPDLLRKEAGYFTGVGGRTYHLDGPPIQGANVAPVSADVMKRHDLRTFKNRVDYMEQGPQNRWKAYGDHLTAFLDAAPKDKPWFFWLGYSDPHHPWNTKGDQGAVDPAQVEVPGDMPDLPGVREDLARYMGEVEHLDGDVQSVLDVLQARGFADDTLVVFMGDNGMAFPLGKGALHDRGIRVPLLVRWPGVVKPGTATADLVSGEDFAPTLLEAVGVAPPKSMSGRSYVKLLRGEPYEKRTHIFAERGPHGGDGGMKADVSSSTFDLARCVRSERYKLIYNCTPHQPYGPVDSKGDAGWQEILAAHREGKLDPKFERAYFTNPRPIYELYDLQSDPDEMINLAGKPEVAEVERSLKAALSEEMILDWDFLPLPVR